MGQVGMFNAIIQALDRAGANDAIQICWARDHPSSLGRIRRSIVEWAKIEKTSTLPQAFCDAYEIQITSASAVVM